MLERELVRRTTRTERRLDGLATPEISPDLISPLLALPMLRGAWAASVISGGDWYDISGEGRHLTYQGDPTFNYDGVVPYWDYDGTGDYHNRADEPHLDITGLETYVAAAARGLTLGGWFWVDTLPGTSYALMSKWGAAGTNDQAYYLDIQSTGTLRFIISNTGADAFSVPSLVAFGANEWIFVVGRFDPGATNEIKIFYNGQSNTNAAGIPASVRNSASDFMIGEYAVGGRQLDGRAACCFLCAAALSDDIISSLFQQQRAAFGV